MTLLVMVAAGRLAASHLGLDKDATALSLFGLPRSQEIISISIIMELTVYASPGVAFRDWPLNFHPREADASVFEPGPVRLSTAKTRGTLALASKLTYQQI